MDAGWWPISWRDRSGEVYEAHKHDADQTLYLVEGFMELSVGAKTYRLNPGVRLPPRLTQTVKTQLAVR